MTIVEYLITLLTSKWVILLRNTVKLILQWRRCLTVIDQAFRVTTTARAERMDCASVWRSMQDPDVNIMHVRIVL